MGKKYRKDHEKIKVKCPVCGRIMSGWYYSSEICEWYEIVHRNSSKRLNRKPCMVSKGQIDAIKVQWEAKYETIEDGQ